MPSQDKQTLCFYGDSHLGCVKHAIDDGVRGADDYDIEFWGSFGPDFRKLRLTDGAIVPDKDAEDSVDLINGKGRKLLRPDDFDIIVFHACRVRAFNFMSEFLNIARSEDAHVSAAVRSATLDAWLEGIRSFRIAREFAKAKKARIYFTSVPFLTDGIGSDPLAGKAAAETADKQDRAALWAELGSKFENAGIRFLAQPERTITRGCMTKSEYGVPTAVELNDNAHKNAAYGALVVRQVFAAIAEDKAGKDASADADLQSAA